VSSTPHLSVTLQFIRFFFFWCFEIREQLIISAYRRGKTFLIFLYRANKRLARHSLLHQYAGVDFIANVSSLLLITESSIEWRTLDYIIGVRNMHQTIINRTRSRLNQLLQKYSFYAISVPRSTINSFLFFFYYFFSITGSIAFFFTIIVGIAWYEDCPYFNCDSVFKQ